MMKARLTKEVVVKVRNEIGVLFQLAKLIAEKGVNILAASAWVEGENGVIHIVTDDNLRVMDALRAKSYNPKESDAVVLEMPHKSGMLRHITETLSKDGIDIHHLYASAPAHADTSLIVFSSANNDRAVVLLNE